MRSCQKVTLTTRDSPISIPHTAFPVFQLAFKARAKDKIPALRSLLMKPRNTIAQTESCTRLSLDLMEHDGRLFLECEGRQVDATHLGMAARQLVGIAARPFRPARQPRLIFLGLGFGHAVLEACTALPQEKASFVVLPEAAELPGWLEQHLDVSPLDDERIHIESSSPFAPLPSEYTNCQCIIADLDHLEALAPKKWSITSPNILGGLYPLRPGLGKGLTQIRIRSRDRLRGTF